MIHPAVLRVQKTVLFVTMLVSAYVALVSALRVKILRKRFLAHFANAETSDVTYMSRKCVEALKEACANAINVSVKEFGQGVIVVKRIALWFRKIVYGTEQCVVVMGNVTVENARVMLDIKELIAKFVHLAQVSAQTTEIVFCAKSSNAGTQKLAKTAL